MKHTKENIINLLKAKIVHLRAMEEIYKKEGDSDLAERYKHERWGLDSVLQLMTNKEYFDKIYNIYKDDIEEVKNKAWY